jgi:four helix bundle protein
MGKRRRVAVQEAADLVADEVNRLIDSKTRRRLLHVAQLRKCSNSVSANIAEGLGRGEGASRDDDYRTARGEAKETISHLRSNFAAKRLESTVYWRLRNRSMTVIKMLDSLLGE